MSILQYLDKRDENGLLLRYSSSPPISITKNLEPNRPSVSSKGRGSV